ncbi:hypothetical protein BBP40_008861 [Aspergillus hancockii]|nr:hypothetical protein BBP40_008861 [Aspergillus hancockii]
MIAIAKGQPDAMMTAYNKVNGIHAAESPKLLQDILRDEWGWDGMLMSDWFGTYSTSESVQARMTRQNCSGAVEERGTMELEAGREYNIQGQWGCAKTSKFKVPGIVDFGHGGFQFGACKRLLPEDGIEEAVKLANSVDQVVLAVGLSAEWGSEDEDRTSMELPPFTDLLISRVLAANPNTAIVLQSGTPVEMPWIHEAKAVMHAWYGGNDTGNAIATVIFGDVNPVNALRKTLPLNFPRRIKDNPTYFNYRSEGGRVLYGEDVYVGYRYYDEAKHLILEDEFVIYFRRHQVLGVDGL